MPPLPRARDSDATGKLVFSAGSICLHYSRKFLTEKANPATLPKEYHVARKKILYADPATGARRRRRRRHTALLRGPIEVTRAHLTRHRGRAHGGQETRDGQHGREAGVVHI